MLYLISYDLKTPGKDYPKLTQALTKMGAVKVLLSAWLLPSDNTSLQVLNAIEASRDENDRIFATEITTGSAWRQNLLATSDVIKRLILEHARA